MKNKKIFLSLGSIFAITPFITIVACGNNQKTTTIDAKKVETALNALDQGALKISGPSGSGAITQATLDALATGDLAHVTISADVVADISNADKITLTATPKKGYVFNGGESSLTHEIIISGLAIGIATSDAQTALNAIDQGALSITGDSGSGTIAQATLDGLSTGNLEHVTVSADKVANIANKDTITLTATPKSGYAFSGGESTLNNQINISGLTMMTITTADAQNALNAIDQGALNITGDSGSGVIAQATLDALATGNLEHVTISANQTTNIANTNVVTLTATPKPGYAFSGGETHLTHPITINGLTMTITTTDAQIALSAIDQGALKILGGEGTGTIAQATLDALATGNLANVDISADKMTDIADSNIITLSATPKTGYTFSGGETHLTHQIYISGLPTSITTADAWNALSAINQNALNISVNSGLGTITQATLDALATGNLANVTISADEMTNIANGSTIILTATPKTGYAFSGGQSHLAHQIIVSGVSGLKTGIDGNKVKDVLYFIRQSDLKISGATGSGVIAQATLDGLSTGNLANVTISANKMTNIANGDEIILTPRPKTGYVFIGDKSDLLNKIIISGL